MIFEEFLEFIFMKLARIILLKFLYARLNLHEHDLILITRHNLLLVKYFLLKASIHGWPLTF